MKNIFLILLIAVSTSALFYPATSPVFTYSGRRYTQGTSIRYDWPCFKVAFCFESATQVQWHVRDTWNIYVITIDNRTSSKIEPANNIIIDIFTSN